MELGKKLDIRWNRNFRAHQRRVSIKEKSVQFLGGRCIICGYDKCISAMDFHHPDTNTKDFNISSKTVWNEKLRQELLKTILLCSNCHREVHAGWHPSMIEPE